MRLSATVIVRIYNNSGKLINCQSDFQLPKFSNYFTYGLPTPIFACHFLSVKNKLCIYIRTKIKTDLNEYVFIDF